MRTSQHAFILGAGKCGTTTLSAAFAAHPEICMPAGGWECPYFSSDFGQGLDYYWESYFASGWRGEPVTCDAHPRNLFLPFVAERIKGSFDAPKLIVVLRNPTERAYAHWWHRYSRRYETEDFVSALADDQARIERGETFDGPEGVRRWDDNIRSRGRYLETGYRTYLDGGHFADQIEIYLDTFGPDNLLVLFLEDGLTARTLAPVWRLLEVADPGIEPSVENTARYLHERRRGPVGPVGARLVRSRVWGKLPDPARGILMRRVPRPPLAPDVRRRLDEHYAPRNRRLREVLGRDLPAAWAQ